MTAPRVDAGITFAYIQPNIYQSVPFAVGVLLVNVSHDLSLFAGYLTAVLASSVIALSFCVMARLSYEESRRDVGRAKTTAKIQALLHRSRNTPAHFADQDVLDFCDECRKWDYDKSKPRGERYGSTMHWADEINLGR